ncbi:hypothetical protein ACFL09_00510, partial [Planctomycetota bacterium]
MTSTPPSTPRALWILARMGLRIWVNRLLAFPRRLIKIGGGRQRAATARKGPSAIALAFVAAAFFLVALTIAGRLVTNLAVTIGQGPAWGELLREGRAAAS